jgi:hypothetical protein
VNGLVRGYDVKPLPGEHESGSRHHWVTRHGPEAIIDRTVRQLWIMLVTCADSY